MTQAAATNEKGGGQYDPSEWLTVKEFAERVHAPVGTVRKWIERGVICAGMKRRRLNLIHVGEVARVLQPHPLATRARRD